MLIKKFILYLSLFLMPVLGKAQAIFERHTNEVYSFLSTMSQKGHIEWNDLVTPLPKNVILSALQILDTHKEQLNQVEQIELAFYLKQFQNKDLLTPYQQIKHNDFNLIYTPLVATGYQVGSSISVVKRSIGFNIWGQDTKHWGFQFSFQDINENGRGLDSGAFDLMYGSTTGKMIFRDPNQPNNQNYAEIRGHISYAFKNGYISVGQDYLNWGYGENGKIVLSDKAPTYPYLRFHYQPTHWLTFEYSHAWLHSAVVDSNATYTIPNSVFDFKREVFINKYMASHSLDFRIKKGVHFSLGESVIYNDQLQPGYLLPIMFFKAYDNIINRSAIQSGSNGQFFFQLNARNQWVAKSNIYATLFIDEIRLSKILDKSSARNQLGYNIGASITDVFIPTLKIGVEYTRIRPFVYRNFLPAQNYTHHQFLLGDWIGSNADKWIGYVNFKPIPKMKLQVSYQAVRKGAAGTLWQQYFEKPQMTFLNKELRHYDEVNTSISYQWMAKCVFSAQYIHRFQYPSVASMGIQFGF